MCGQQSNCFTLLLSFQMSLLNDDVKCECQKKLCPTAACDSVASKFFHFPARFRTSWSSKFIFFHFLTRPNLHVSILLWVPDPLCATVRVDGFSGFYTQQFFLRTSGNCSTGLPWLAEIQTMSTFLINWWPQVQVYLHAQFDYNNYTLKSSRMNCLFLAYFEH